MNQFKRAKAIMLSTNEKSLNSVFTIRSDKPYLMSERNSPFKARIYDTKELYHTYYNLYFISDDEIKVGDHVFNIKDNHYGGIVNENNLLDAKLLSYIKKIIVTTDTSLKIVIKNHNDFDSEHLLSQPSQQFIEQFIEYYNKGEVITEVLVEYEIYQDSINYHKDIWKNFERIKINPKDNTITIKKLKDSWNREEVNQFAIKAFQAGFDYCGAGHLGCPDESNWIEENL